MVRELHLAGREAFFDEVEAAVVKQDGQPGRPGQDGTVTVPQLRAAVAEADPARTPEQVDELLREGVLMAGEAYGRPELAGTLAGWTTLAGKGLVLKGQELPHESFKFEVEQFMQLLRRSDVARVTGAVTNPLLLEPEPELEPELEPQPEA